MDIEYLKNVSAIQEYNSETIDTHFLCTRKGTEHAKKRELEENKPVDAISSLCLCMLCFSARVKYFLLSLKRKTYTHNTLPQ